MALSLASIELAVLRATDDDLAALDANIAATERVMDDPAAVAAYDSEFHILLERSGRNRVLELAREPSNMLIYPTTQEAVGGSAHGAQRLIQAHRMTVEAVRPRAKANNGRGACRGRG